MYDAISIYHRTSVAHLRGWQNISWYVRVRLCLLLAHGVTQDAV